MTYNLELSLKDGYTHELTAARGTVVMWKKQKSRNLAIYRVTLLIVILILATCNMVHGPSVSTSPGSQLEGEPSALRPALTTDCVHFSVSRNLHIPSNLSATELCNLQCPDLSRPPLPHLWNRIISTLQVQLEN